MPRLDVLIEKGEICRCLRAKTMFYRPALEDREAEAAAPEGPFWCSLTQSLLGPDGQVADAESCRPGRSCCETA